MITTKGDMVRQIIRGGAVLAAGAGAVLALAHPAGAAEMRGVERSQGAVRVAEQAAVRLPSCFIWAYSKKYFEGERVCIKNNRDLTFTNIKWPNAGDSIDNGISSLKIHRICWMKLYTKKGLEGDYSHWKSTGTSGPDWREDMDLSNNKVGDNAASSQESRCGL